MPTAPKQHRPPHHGQAKREYEQRRHSASERGYDSWWNKYKEPALREINVREHEALAKCRYCMRVDSVMLDHAIPPTRIFAVGTPAFYRLFREPLLHVPACARCNTLKEDKLPHELPQQMRERLEAVLMSRGVRWQDYVR